MKIILDTSAYVGFKRNAFEAVELAQIGKITSDHPDKAALCNNIFAASSQLTKMNKEVSIPAVFKDMSAFVPT